MARSKRSFTVKLITGATMRVTPRTPPPRPGFAWTSVDTRTRQCTTPLGDYIATTDGQGLWNARYEARTGRAKNIAFRVSAAEAVAMCQKHHLAEATDAFLHKNKAGALVRGDLAGDAQAWRKKRR